MTTHIAKLKDVAKFINGKAFKPTDWSETGLPIIRIQNLNNKEKDFNYWNGALDKQVLVEKNNLLFAWSGTPGTSFGAHIWSGERAVLNQHIFRVDINNKLITKNYAKLAINAKINKLIEQAHGGVGLQHVTKGMVENLEIPLPPLAEQKRIAAILDKANEIKAKRELALAKLDELAQSTFIEMFGNPIRNTKNITQIELGKCISLLGGAAFKSTDYVDDGIPVIRIGEVNRKEFDSDSNCYLPNKFVENYGRFLIDNGSLLMSLTGTTGKDDYGNVVILNGNKPKYFLNQRVACIKPDPKIFRTEYLYFLLKNVEIKNKIISKSRGVRQANISNGDITSLIVPVPSIRDQLIFEKIIIKINTQIHLAQKMLRKQSDLALSLQHQAFTTGFHS